MYLFETDTSPEAEVFGFGFSDCIHYYAGGEEVFPDTDVANWAVKNGITSGTSATTFSPNADCSRAQIVTFLYRCLGK